MIQMQTMLDVADNSGARRLMCIKVLGGSHRRYAHIGDVIKVSVRTRFLAVKVNKGEVYNAVVVRTRKGAAARWFADPVSTAMPRCCSTTNWNRSVPAFRASDPRTARRAVHEDYFPGAGSAVRREEGGNAQNSKRR